MDQVILLTGKKKTDTGYVEVYQLLTGLEYLSRLYDYTEDRTSFYEEVSDVFVQKILQEQQPIVVMLSQGIMINTETEKTEIISNLEYELVKCFSERISTKLMKENPAAFLAPSLN